MRSFLGKMFGSSQAHDANAELDKQPRAENFSSFSNGLPSGDFAHPSGHLDKSNIKFEPQQGDEEDRENDDDENEGEEIDLPSLTQRLVSESLRQSFSQQEEIAASSQMPANDRRPTPSFTPINQSSLPKVSTPQEPSSSALVPRGGRSKKRRSALAEEVQGPDNHMTIAAVELPAASTPFTNGVSSTKKKGKKRRATIDEPEESTPPLKVTDEPVPKPKKSKKRRATVAETEQTTVSAIAMNESASKPKKGKKKRSSVIEDEPSVAEPEPSVGELEPVMALIETPANSSRSRKRRLPTEGPTSSNKIVASRMKKSATKPKSRKSTTEPVDHEEDIDASPNSLSMAKTPKKVVRISNEQLAEIADIVEDFRNEYDMSQHDLNEMIQDSLTGRMKILVTNIHDQFGEITREKITSTLRRKYHNFEARGKWTEEQDEELRDLYERHGPKWKAIGALMERFHEDCRDRFRNYLVCGDQQRKAFWTKDEEDKLHGIVDETIEGICERDNFTIENEQDQARAEGLIDWDTISRKMDRTRSRLQCLTKWKKLVARMKADGKEFSIDHPDSSSWRMKIAREDVMAMSPAEKLRILSAIKNSGAVQEDKIPWSLLQRDFLGKEMGSRMAMKLCFRRLKERIPRYDDMEFPEVVDILITAFEEAAPREPAQFTIRDVSELVENRKRKQRSGDDIEPPSTKKRKATSTPRPKSNQTLVNGERPDNGEGPSTRKLSITNSRRPSLRQSTDSGKKRQKLRDRMTEDTRDQPRTPERETSGGESDILATMQSLKNGKSKAKRVAKVPLAMAKSSRPKGKVSKVSNKRVTASDDESEIGLGNPEKSLEETLNDVRHTSMENDEVEENHIEAEMDRIDDREVDQDDQNRVGDDYAEHDEDQMDLDQDDQNELELTHRPILATDVHYDHESDNPSGHEYLPEYIHDEARLNGVSSASHEKPKFPGNTTPGEDSDTDAPEESFTLPTHPHQNPVFGAHAPSATSSSESDPENEHDAQDNTIITHDQQSVDLDLDNSNDEDPEDTVIHHDQASVDLDDEEEAEGEDDDLEATVLTRNRASIELDYTDVPEPEPENEDGVEHIVNGNLSHDSDASESEFEPDINGVNEHSDVEDVEDADPNPREDEEAASASQPPASRRGGYADINHNSPSPSPSASPAPSPEPEAEQTLPPPRQNGTGRQRAMSNISVSSDASSIPRYVTSSKPVFPGAGQDASESESGGDAYEDEDSESGVEEEELVEKYADEDVDDDYEEATPRRRRH